MTSSPGFVPPPPPTTTTTTSNTASTSSSSSRHHHSASSSSSHHHHPSRSQTPTSASTPSAGGPAAPPPPPQPSWAAPPPPPAAADSFHHCRTRSMTAVDGLASRLAVRRVGGDPMGAPPSTETVAHMPLPPPPPSSPPPPPDEEEEEPPPPPPPPPEEEEEEGEEPVAAPLPSPSPPLPPGTGPRTTTMMMPSAAAPAVAANQQPGMGRRGAVRVEHEAVKWRSPSLPPDRNRGVSPVKPPGTLPSSGLRGSEPVITQAATADSPPPSNPRLTMGRRFPMIGTRSTASPPPSLPEHLLRPRTERPKSMMLMQSNSNFLSMSASFIAPPPLIIPHSQSMTVLSQSNKSTSFPSSQLASSPTIPPTEPGAPTTPPPGANLPPPPPMDLTPPTTPPGFDLPPPPPVDVGPPTAPPNDLPPPFIPPPTDPALSSVATSITTSSPLSSMYGSPLSPNSLAPTATGDWVHALDSEQLEQLPQKLKKRQQVANEILVTEKTYVDVLNIIVEKFFYPLKKDGLGVSKNEVYEMFSNIEVIRDCHERLKQSISKVVECWGDNSGLSEIFLATGWIRFYKYYVNNYGVSMSTLRIAREKHPAFSAYLKGLDYSKALNGLNLEGLLIAPVQRIPRYVLLLSDMLRSTPSVHPDFHGLTEALHVIKELADYVNLQKQISDNQAELDVIQAKIKGYDGSDLSGVKKRKFIKAGDLEINKTMSRLWLFSDLIIVTLPESKKGTFKYKSTVNLKTASAQPCDGVRFAIVALEGTKNCKAVSTTEAEEWRAAISNAISAQQESMLQDLFTKRDTAESEGSKVFEEHRDAEYEEKRENMVSQLLATEADYVSYLTLTYETYLLPIKKAADSGGAMIKPAIAEQVLSNFEALVRIHKEFHEDVKQRQEEWQSNKTLTDLFEKYEKPFFQPLYTQYVSHKPSQLKALVAAQTNEIFNFWLRDLESRERGDLKVLLERPMKRVSDYYLLTQEMLQSTTKKHPDFDKLSHIVTSLKSLSGDLARLAVSEPSATSRSRSKSTSSKLSGH